MRKTLFQEKNSSIWIKIDIYTTEQKQLVVYGHDSGKTVEKIKGQYDYEYYMTLEKEAVQELLQKVEVNTVEELFVFLTSEYSTDRAFSQIKEKLEELQIKYDFSTW